MNVPEALVEYLARLSRLRLPEGEAARMAGELGEILSYFEVLNTLDDSRATPADTVFPTHNVTRPDLPLPSLPRAALLANASATDGAFFLVPMATE